MSAAVKAIVGVVLIAVGEFTTIWGGQALVQIGISLLVNAAASFFIRAHRAAPITGISINYTGTLEPRRIIYGTMKLGGRNVIPR